MSAPKRLTLIDGSGFIFRAFFAMPNLTNKEGTPTGAVYGFVNMMQKLLRDAQNNEFDDYIAVIFDAGRFTFRNEMYDQYKANRDEPPEELKPQFALVREATAALNLPAIELAGFEADDLIASYTRQAKCDGFDEVIIVSSDKDLMQLVDDNAGIHMFDAMKSKVINEAMVDEKFGVPPYKVRDVLALMGDSSDNIPGIAGIGPKTAAQLINHFGDLESLLNRAEEEVPQKKRRESLIEFADDARLSYQLVTLKNDCELPVPLSDCGERDWDTPILREFLQSMGFRKLQEQLDSISGIASDETPAAPESKPEEIKKISYLQADEALLTNMLTQAKAQGKLAIIYEESGMGLCVESGSAIYFPFPLESTQNASKAQATLFAEENAENLKPMIPAVIIEILADKTVLKIGYHIKAAIRSIGTISPVDDVTLLSYVLEAGLENHDFDGLVKRQLQLEPPSDEAALGKGRAKKRWVHADAQDITPILAARADYTMRLWNLQHPQLPHANVASVYEKIERPLLPIMAEMERKGVLLDRTYLANLSTEFKNLIAGLEKEIYTLAGEEFLIGSPKQLGEVLFDKLGIEGGKKSKKSGQYSTGIEVLEELAAQGHIIAEKVVSWRQYEKLRSTYTDALQNQIEDDGRVHTTLQQTVAATGRLSSTDPNLQNIPIRTDEGKRIRQAFIAKSGYRLVAADYSQIELRLLAEMADMNELKEAFRKGQDIHAATASQMFNIPLDEMTFEYRRRAKTINFGIIYGISAHGLAVRLGIERSDAAKFIDAYFELYPGIRAYMEAKKMEAKEYGFITTLYGRKVHIKGINDKNYNMRAFAERQAINAPLQGTAADIIKRAMIAIDGEYGNNEDVRMLLQVHDELLFEIADNKAEKITANIVQIMQNAAHLSLPLVVEAGIGNNWGEIH